MKLLAFCRKYKLPPIADLQLMINKASDLCRSATCHLEPASSDLRMCTCTVPQAISIRSMVRICKWAGSGLLLHYSEAQAFIGKTGAVSLLSRQALSRPGTKASRDVGHFCVTLQASKTNSRQNGSVKQLQIGLNEYAHRPGPQKAPCGSGSASKLFTWQSTTATTPLKVKQATARCI